MPTSAEHLRRARTECFVGRGEIKLEKEEVKFSAKGCAICEDPICYVCWDKGYYKHSNNSTV
jgi:hypothetical protein